jgi:hypothetical protein
VRDTLQACERCGVRGDCRPTGWPDPQRRRLCCLVRLSIPEESTTRQWDPPGLAMKSLGLKLVLLGVALLAGVAEESVAAECLACQAGKATGGGQIEGELAELTILRGTAAGGRANFGFNAQFVAGNSLPSGHLNFIDHASKKDVKSTSIDSFAVAGNRAVLSGRASVDGVPGSGFAVEVEDLGEPGSGEVNPDTFSIALTDGYWAAGVLIKGNIQVQAGSPGDGDEDGDGGPPPLGPFGHLFGSMHNHTAYSDGEGRPEDAFAAGKAAGLNYLFVTEHSEWLEFPFKASEDCLDPRNTPGCEAAPPPGKTEWQDVKDQGEIASNPAVPYLGLRGFEWSSPTLGHLNVLLSSNYIGNGPTAPTMDAFWRWFLLDKELGGGSDGLGVFNHPSRERHPIASLQTFEDFRYVPEADSRMVGLEVFNRGEDYSACYVRALGKGWHLGAIGAADNHEDWARPDRSRTALVVDQGRFEEFTPDAVREALARRRFYATFDHNLQLTYKADGNWMGSRLKRDAGQSVALSIEAADLDAGDRVSRIEIYGSGIPEPVCDRDQRDAAGDRRTILKATPLAAADFDSQNASLQVTVLPPPGKESWYFAKVIQADGQVAYTSPVWITVPEGPPPQGSWIAGDLHVHTTYSHDVCDPAAPAISASMSPGRRGSPPRSRSPSQNRADSAFLP